MLRLPPLLLRSCGAPHPEGKKHEELVRNTTQDEPKVYVIPGLVGVIAVV